jgi:hypothetical protein
MPPPGVAPPDVPQVGYPGGGAHPSTDPYTAAMAPDGTVPIAVFPPFAEYKKTPTKCVVFSELTDFEQDPIDYGDGIQVCNHSEYLCLTRQYNFLSMVILSKDIYSTIILSSFCLLTEILS